MGMGLLRASFAREMVVLLERGMTAAAFEAYLEGEGAELQSLVGLLAGGVDGDLLIETTKQCGKADPVALRPFFIEGTMIGRYAPSPCGPRAAR